MTRLYADEDFPPAVVNALRGLGHDVLRVQEVGKANQQIPDEDVLAYAISLGRAVLTHNRWDYIRLHRWVRPHCGIVVCSKDPAYVAQAQKIHQALLACPVLDDQLVRINKS
jgi:hypothetical protein